MPLPDSSSSKNQGAPDDIPIVPTSDSEPLAPRVHRLQPEDLEQVKEGVQLAFERSVIIPDDSVIQQ